MTALYPENLTIKCAAKNANLYHWVINGSNNYSKNGSGITVQTPTSKENGTLVGTLIIVVPYDPEKLNGSYVECIAFTHTKKFLLNQNSSAKVLIQIQGIPGIILIDELYVHW